MFYPSWAVAMSKYLRKVGKDFHLSTRDADSGSFGQLNSGLLGYGMAWGARRGCGAAVSLIRLASLHLALIGRLLLRYLREHASCIQPSLNFTLFSLQHLFFAQPMLPGAAVILQGT